MKERLRELDVPDDSGEEKRLEQGGSGEISGDTDERLLSSSPEKYKSADEMTEYGRDIAENTKQDLMAQHREQMGEENVKRLEAHDTRGQVEVLDYQAFRDRFPNAQPGVIGLYHDGKVYAVNGHQDMVNHTVTHETTHLCSHKENTFTENQDGSKQHLYASGLLRVETNVDPDGVRHVSVSNRALNEGLTEMYTMRELASRGDWQAANAYQAYSPQRGYCSRLEGILDPGKLEDAYYGGRLDGLKGNVERLTGDPGAFDRISLNLSALDNLYGHDGSPVCRAVRRGGRSRRLWSIGNHRRDGGGYPIRRNRRHRRRFGSRRRHRRPGRRFRGYRRRNRQ